MDVAIYDCMASHTFAPKEFLHITAFCKKPKDGINKPDAGTLNQDNLHIITINN